MENSNKNSIIEGNQQEKVEHIWDPEDKLNFIDDETLNNALFLVDNNFIKSVLFNKEKGSFKILNVIENACKIDTYNNFQDSIRKKSEGCYNLSANPKDKLCPCRINTCNKKFCVIRLAGYIKYLKDNKKLDLVLNERSLFQSKNSNWQKANEYSLQLSNIDKINEMRKAEVEFAKSLSDKIYLEGLGDNTCFRYRCSNFCPGKDKDKNKDKEIKQNIIDFFNEDQTKYKDVTDITPNIGSSLIRRNASSKCSSCELDYCPFRLASYFAYCKATNIDNIDNYTGKTKPPFYYGEPRLNKLNFTHRQVEAMYNFLSTLPDDIFNYIRGLHNKSQFSINSTTRTERIETDRGIVTYIYHGIKFAFKLNTSAKNVEELPEGDGISFFELYDYELGFKSEHNSTFFDVFLKAAYVYDYISRCVDGYERIMKERKAVEKKYKQIIKSNSSLNNIHKFISLDKTNTLFAIIEGKNSLDKELATQSIANMLSRKGKINAATYKSGTIQEFCVKHTHKEGGSDPYYVFSSPSQNCLYVLNGLHAFLQDYELFTGKVEKSFEYRRRSNEHILEVLSSFPKDTYIIISSESEEDTRKFLEMKNSFKFTYGANLIKFRDLTKDELFNTYYENLTSEVKDQIEDIKKFRKKFKEFVAFNEKFLPYSNFELCDYLSNYTNVSGVPSLPSNIYSNEGVQKALNSLVGMNRVKQQLRDFESYVTYQKKAEAAGLKSPRGNMHMLFLGGPGTGKTTIARIIAKMLYDIGITEQDKLVEVQRKDLIAEYIGQTAQKTQKVIDEALGGVLFIDEAYSLSYNNTNNDFGKECVATLIKAMEDHRDNLIVIFAGYENEMFDFLQSNSGIESRIGYTFHFDDYSPKELCQIYERNLKDMGYTLDEKVLSKVEDVSSYFSRRKNFGNARFIVQLVQDTIIKHSLSYSEDKEISKIIEDDIPDIKELTQNSNDHNIIPLEDLIGMENIKQQINLFKKRLDFQNRTRQMGIKLKTGNNHMIFLGNPGTGKTTVARIMAKELYDAGVLLENKLIEVQRKDLVAEYIGQTAPKTQKVIEEAMGGVLFIDEAYTLSMEDDFRDFGPECIATLIKAMEDHRQDLVVIFAGYRNEMNRFVNSNPGIASRIGYTFEFEDYDARELTQIYKMKLNSSSLKIGREELKKIEEVMQFFLTTENFGNGRFSEKLYSMTIDKHAANCSEDPSKDLIKITIEDIPTIQEVSQTIHSVTRIIDPEKIQMEEKTRTAYHEIGHALVTKVLMPETSISKITIAAEANGTLGYVRQEVQSYFTRTKKQIRDQICVWMSGIASEELFLGEYASGGWEDLDNATKLAGRMINRFGMSENGFASKTELNDGDYTEVNLILREEFERAKSIISSKKDQVEAVKKLLLKNKTINEDDFLKIMKVKQ